MKFWNWSAAKVCRVLPAAMATVGWVALNSAAWADHGGGDGDDGDHRAPAPPPVGHQRGYQQINLVADVPGLAAHNDTNLLNPWGLVIGSAGDLIVADNHSGLAAFYGADGGAVRMPIQVDDDPTGVAINHASGEFLLTDGTNSHPARLLFSTESGKILGWSREFNPGNAVVVADNSSSNAVYKGIALARTRAGARLYAADFHNAKVDVFDGSFHRIGSFTDPNLENGFAPFNVENIGGWLFVTFAKQLGPDNDDDQAGPGNGFVDIFRTDGHLARRFATHGALDSPWGLAIAPRSFGKFRGALLIGNFGDGRINAYNLRTGAFLGPLADSLGTPIEIEGLWALRFGRESDSGHGDEDDEEPNNALYFTSGPGGESHGLLGVIVPVPRLHHGD